jgi:hypothetical protein
VGVFGVSYCQTAILQECAMSTPLHNTDFFGLIARRETALPEPTFPATSPFSLEQTLDPDYCPD